MEKCFCGSTEFSKDAHHYWDVTPEGKYVQAAGKLSLGVCKHCGAIRQLALPFSNNEEYLQYYAQYPPTGKAYRVKDTAHDREVAKKRCDHYGIHPSSELLVLDIGSGSGAFVEECRKRGARAVGCEIAEYHDLVAGEFTYRKPFEDIHFPTDHFDVVTCHDVLEHVLDPLSFIREAGRVLKQGGALRVDLPAFFEPEGDHHWKQEHIWYLRPKQVRRLCEAAGLVLASVERPVPSKYLLTITKPGQERPTILVPPGIGDSYWSIVKLPSFLKERNLGLPEVSVVCPRAKSHNGHQRAFPFLEMFPFLKASWDTVGGRDKASRAIWKEAYAQEGRTVFEDVLGFDYFLSYNGHLRVGKELAEIDRFACEWHPPMWVSLEQENFRTGCQQRYGRYAVFYFVFQGTYKYWTDEFPISEVIKSVREICSKTGLRPVFTGGPWDAEDRQLQSVLRAVPEAVNIIGRTTVQQLFGLLRGAELVVGYPSGLTIMSGVLGCKTLSIWNTYYNQDFFWRAVPPDVRGKTYFVDVTTGLKAEYLARRAHSILSGNPIPVESSPSRTRLVAPTIPPTASPKSASDSPSVTVACVYKTGGDFTAEYVHKLVSAIRRHSSFELDVVCLTDDAALTGNFRTVALEKDLPGWWSKLELFRPGLTEKKRILYFDLDTLILKNIDHLLQFEAPFAALLPWNSANRARKQLASGAMLWDHAMFSQLFHNGYRPEQLGQYAGDQEFLSEKINAGRYTWTPLQTVAKIHSYKRECRRRVPRDAEIICFHGKPRPHELQIPWVVENWR